MKLLIIIFTIGLTITTYIVSRYVSMKTKNPLLNPVFISTIVIISVLTGLGLDFDAYKPGKEIMTFLLGPATVALALPLYRNRKVLANTMAAVITGVAAGSVATIVSVVLLARAWGLERKIILSLAPKSITAPIGIEVSKIIGGDPSLTAAFVVATGMIGAIIGPWFLTNMKVSSPVARGLAIGTISHGQGTAVALEEGETQGAMASVAMALAAIFTSFVAPFLIPTIVK